MDEDQPYWRYERGAHRYKHRWNRDDAGFEPGKRGPIGKCPKWMTAELAEKVLNEGCPLYEDEEATHPDRIYGYYNGVIYEAVPTTPGCSYHGYPWRGDLKGRTPPPRRVFRHLEQQAEAADEIREYRRWLKNYGGSATR